VGTVGIYGAENRSFLDGHQTHISKQSKPTESKNSHIMPPALTDQESSTAYPASRKIG
jgi:hypothetical protein